MLQCYCSSLICPKTSWACCLPLTMHKHDSPMSLFGPGLAIFIAAWWFLVHSSLHFSHISRPQIFSPSFHSRLHHEHDAVVRYSSTNTTPYPALLRMSHILLPFLLEVMRDPGRDKSITLWTGDSERPVCTLRRDKYRSFSHQKENMVH